MPSNMWRTAVRVALRSAAGFLAELQYLGIWRPQPTLYLIKLFLECLHPIPGQGHLFFCAAFGGWGGMIQIQFRARPLIARLRLAQGSLYILQLPLQLCSALLKPHGQGMNISLPGVADVSS